VRQEDLQQLFAQVERLVKEVEEARQDIPALQAAHQSLHADNAALRRNVDGLNRAANELRRVVDGYRTQLAQRQADIKRLENKLELAQEQRDGDKQALRIGRLVVGMLKTSPLGGRDLIDALQAAVDHLDGDDLEPVKHFGVREEPEA
jgi:ABC-type transporter Mla subunit MlaD